MKYLIAFVFFATSAFGAPEDRRSYGPQDASNRLLLRGTTDLAVFDSVLTLFADQNPDLRLDYEQWSSNGLYTMAVSACSGTAEAADLLISSSVDQQVKLVNDGCAQPYISAATAALPATANWRNEVFGITREPAVIVYNRDLVPEQDLPLSRFHLIDLLREQDGRYDGKVATYDIEQSGLGYLFAFADSQQAMTFGSLTEAFARGKAVTTCCSSEIIDQVSSGKYLIAYNILGSYALARAAADPKIGVIAPSDYTLMLSRAALIPKRARNPTAAGRFIEFLISDAGHNALAAEQLYLTPTQMRDKGLLGEEVSGTNLRPIPLSPIMLVGLDYQRRLHFIQQWQATFSGR
jgi:iron(III) transport system substrate-binding protein